LNTTYKRCITKTRSHSDYRGRSTRAPSTTEKTEEGTCRARRHSMGLSEGVGVCARVDVIATPGDGTTSSR
jgi:hypothetical protein